MHESLLRTVVWTDLLRLRKREILHELLISCPWFAASLYAFCTGYYLPALIASFMFFLAGLRQVHNAFHHSLGLPRWMSAWVMFALSILMLGSMHAVQINHLRHHLHCMSDDDVEAMGARLSWLGAMLLGPRYPIELHRKALQVASPDQRRWIHAELAANVLWVAAVFLIFDSAALKYHVIAMAVGQCFTAFFAVWTTHHDCNKDGLFARTIRNRIKATITYNMFYHFEHHLFPAVPTCKLPELARRLDAVVPTLGLKNVY
jgi:fatty acid desaturase